MPRYRCAIVSVALATGRRRRSVTVAVLLALHCIPGLTCLKGQTSSVIEGTLTDPQGMVIAGAVISLSGSGMGETRFRSDSSGSYRLPGLQAGTYNLRISKPGFAIKVYTGLTVAVNC